MIADLDRNIFKKLFNSFSNNSHSVKVVDLQNRKKKRNKMEKWAYLTIRQKS